jgi:hypothetical protein
MQIQMSWSCIAADEIEVSDEWTSKQIAVQAY